MTDREFYEKIGELNMDKDHELVTVIGGPDAGGKVLFTDGDMDYATDQKTAAHISALPEKDLLREKLGRRKTLVVCGAGFVGQDVIRLGRYLGCRVIAVDDRADFSKMAEKAGADLTLTDDFASALSSGKIPFDPDTWFVVVTRGHRFDKECLLEIMKHDFGYLGMMGSRARSAGMRQTLSEEQVPEEKISLLHAPVGLKIGAQTPEEIAVSIIAEIIEEKQKHPGKTVFSEDILQALSESEPGKAVLCTIIRRRGSTPRQAGVRMLVKGDRTTAGTVGGGCMEAEVIREAASMMAAAGLGISSGQERQIFTVDLTGRSGQDADMLCGGAMDLLLELL